MLRAAVNIDPSNADAHYNLGNALFDGSPTSDLSEIEAEYRAAVKINPDVPEFHFNLALALNSQGHVGEAEVEYQAAKEIDPSEYSAQTLALY